MSLDQGLERLVHRRQTDLRQLVAHGPVHLFGRGMTDDPLQVREYGRPLCGVSAAGLFQSLAHASSRFRRQRNRLVSMLERTGEKLFVHQANYMRSKR